MRLRAVLALAAILASVGLAASDLTITFTTSGKGAAGPGGEVQYYSSEFQKVHNEKNGTDTLVDFKAGVTYSIDHKKKSITKITFEDAMAALDTLGKAMPQGLGAMMAGMFGDPGDCQVTKLGTETVAGRPCQDWSVRVGKMTMDLAVDPTLKTPLPDSSMAKLLQTQAAQFAKAGPMGAIYKRLYEELAKIKGVQLKSHLNGMMGMDSTREATKIDASAIPAGTFALPAGYKIEDLGKKMREEMKGR